MGILMDGRTDITTHFMVMTDDIATYKTETIITVLTRDDKILSRKKPATY